ncbi:MAG: hypothetical protein ACREPU_04250 [Rhodanobacteraceae bacterium]
MQVRLHASSLNYHDYLVVTGVLPVPEGRIPMVDGAGEVEWFRAHLADEFVCIESDGSVHFKDEFLRMTAFGFRSCRV